MKKSSILAALFLTSGLTSAQSLQPLRVGILLPQSGVYANLGNGLRNGATLSLQSAQSEFAKLGFDLQIFNLDDKGSPETALKKAAQIAADPTVLIAVGPAISESSMVVTPLFSQRGLAVVNPFSIVNELTEMNWGNVVRIVPRADTFTLAEADYVADQLKVKSITLVNNGSKLGVERMAMLKGRFQSKKVQVQGVLTVGPDTNFTEVAKKIVASNPESVHMAISQYTVSGGMVNALRAAGYNKGIFTSAVLNPAFAKLTGENYKGLYYISNITTVNAYPQAVPFVKTFLKQFKVAPTPIGLIGHDAMDVALEALRIAIKDNRGKLPSRKDVVVALKAVAVKGFTGDISFSKAGERLNCPIYVIQVGNDSVGRVVGALNVASSKP